MRLVKTRLAIVLGTLISAPSVYAHDANNDEKELDSDFDENWNFFVGVNNLNDKTLPCRC